jgi:Ohr subfamily peroxiredoxin
MPDKLHYTGKTHNTSGKSGGTRSDDGLLNLKLPEAHPAAENLFSAAWSACYMAAIQHVAMQKKIKIAGDLAVDTTVDLLQGDSGFYLRANMKVTVPGVDRAQAKDLIDTAHTVCPYSKAVHGNIDVTTTLA